VNSEFSPVAVTAVLSYLLMDYNSSIYSLFMSFHKWYYDVFLWNTKGEILKHIYSIYILIFYFLSHIVFWLDEEGVCVTGISFSVYAL